MSKQTNGKLKFIANKWSFMVESRLISLLKSAKGDSEAATHEKELVTFRVQNEIFKYCELQNYICWLFDKIKEYKFSCLEMNELVKILPVNVHEDEPVIFPNGITPREYLKLLRLTCKRNNKQDVDWASHPVLYINKEAQNTSDSESKLQAECIEQLKELCRLWLTSPDTTISDKMTVFPNNPELWEVD